MVFRSHTHVGREGCYAGECSARSQAKVILFNANVKNFGPVPGTHYVGKWRVFLGGTELPANKALDAPLTIFPSPNHAFRGANW